MENNDNFNRIVEMNAEAERRKIAAQIMASMMQNAKWGDKYSHIATMALSATDHEVCIVAHFIKDKLKFIKLDEDKDAARDYCAIHDDGIVCANNPQLPRYWGELTM